MNQKRRAALVIVLVLAIVAVSGCAPPQATPCPTSEPQSCSTAIVQTCPTAEPQSCPTAAAQAVPGRSGFRAQIASMVNAVITFEPGDKCSMRALNQVIKEDGLLIEVVANDNAYQDYIVWIHYLDPGKTLEDLKTQATDPITPPSFLHILGAVLASPMSRTTYAGQITIDADQGPIFFTCQVYGPGPRKNIDHLGPLEIKQ